ncbi:MAG TPA: phenylalanine--tRNA ligase subunit beta [Pseudomonadales bacterium]|nr:phenylalanine--tRNA ligase subunit beta [Pseudomonadales bacterium]
MKLSEAWLRQWVNPSISTDELVAQITMAGLEVDAVEPVAGEFSGVIVGEIIAANQHPEADRLRVCTVSNGSDMFQVVCGAPNARPGIKVPFAMVGAVLPPGEDGKPFKIKKAKLRGVESHGMLCAEAELQISDANDGLMELPSDATVGADLRDYLQLNDALIEVDLTPNRGDCLSVKGIAREVGVLNQVDVCQPVIAPVPATIDDTLDVRVDAPDYCPRYLGRVIRNIDINATSPMWMVERLRRSGLRSIDPVVDVTNYILLELGQPMHAFDLAKLDGGIVVRYAKQDEALTLLDEQDVTLASNTCVIADHRRALAMAGIMGGADSAVSDTTTDLFLESAFFTPELAAGKARNYGLHTDSSHRYERGVDYALQRDAMERATALLLDIVGGQAGPIVEQVNEQHLPQTAPVALRRSQIGRLLGLTIDDSQVEDILTRLGLGVTANAEGWLVAVPSYRFDIAIEADLLEELARIYGYNNLPVTTLGARLALQAKPENQLELRHLRRHLVSRDYQEAITYSFIEPKLQAVFDPSIAAVTLANPISADMAAMRSSLLPGLVTTIRHNLNRQRSRVRVFESGLRFVPSDKGLVQEPMLAFAACGNNHNDSWHGGTAAVDFYDIKGDVESLLALTGAAHEFAFTPAQRDGMHPGQCAEITRNGEHVGFIGTLHPSVQATLDVSRPVVMAELRLSLIVEAKLPKFKELSKYPEIRRDLALVVDKTIPSSTILDEITKIGGNLFKSARLFDVYEGKGVEQGKRSLALALIFQDQNRTLQDDDVNAAIEIIVAHLGDIFKAVLRA